MIEYIGSELADCPPASATPMNGIFYRLMDTGKVEIQNFRSQVVLGIGGRSECTKYALSLTLSYRYALKIKKRFKAKYKYAKVAKITIKEDCGLLHQNRPDHVNWWHPKGFNPTKIAFIIDNESEIDNDK